LFTNLVFQKEFIMGKQLTPREIALIKEGKKLQAIKAFRERTGLSVEEAKTVIDKEVKKRGL